MIFEYIAGASFDFIRHFTQRFNIPAQTNGYIIPERLGSGFCRRYITENGIIAIINKFCLKEKLILKRIGSGKDLDILVFRFYLYASSDNIYFSNVQLMTHDIDNVDTIPAGVDAYYVVFIVNRSELTGIINLPEYNDNIKAHSFLYQENLTYEMRTIIKDISEFKEEHKLDNLYIEIKVRELIYYFCKEFIDHDREDLATVNKKDIEKILALRDFILTDLGTPPVLKELAGKATMSETKMKQLFKRIYGDSIYNYYQAFRMNEAASLLKKDKSVSISEIAYILGFSNLSHFSRLFTKHMGMLPKEYRRFAV